MRLMLVNVVSVLILLLSTAVNAQISAASADADSKNNDKSVQLVNDLSARISQKMLQRDQLAISARQEKRELTNLESTEIADLTADINRLQRTLLLSVTGESTVSSLYEGPETETTWQEDVVDILKPLADSVKSITQRPRRIAELRTQLEVIQQKKSGLNDAIKKFNAIVSGPLEPRALEYVGGLSASWQEDLQQLEQENVIVASQLEDLLGENDKPFSGAVENFKSFALGSGLTLFLALLTALTVYFFLRAGWWLYSKKVVSKDVRRQSTLYRAFSYGYHIATGIIVLLSVIVVIYVREDLLLLAIAFLILAGIIFNLKQMLPRYVTEARMLLNLGSVREGERVVYDGIPWQVKSINLYSVLHNPALDGIVRLPLSAMKDMISRPVKNKLWFPTSRGDSVILPDGLLGTIKHQTPDLVEITVRGGMAQTYTTAEFYALNIINLSRDETFGVAVTFGLDYSLQKISVVEVPEALHAAIEAKLNKAGYEGKISGLLVELSEANASSLDYLVYVTADKTLANHYYKLQRLVLQACVEESNARGWTIPYPQLVVHSANEKPLALAGIT